MNYQRGFKRIYAVGVVAWIAVVLFLLPSYRLKFWIPNVDYDAIAEQIRQAHKDDIWDRAGKSASNTPGTFIPPPLSSRELPDENFVALGKATKALYPGSYDDLDDAALGVAVARKYPGLLKHPTPAFLDSPGGKLLWLAGVLLVPPFSGYLGLFLVVPWIYRKRLTNPS